LNGTNQRATIGFGLNSGLTTGWIMGQDLYYNGTKDFYLYDLSNALARLYINTSGNVGIGTTGPIGKLEVRGDTSAGYAVVSSWSNSATNANYGGYLALNSAGNGMFMTAGDVSYTPTYYAKAMWGTIAGTGNVGLRFGANARSDDMVIATTGSVGIGTTAPGQKLSIAGGNIFTTNAGGANGFFMGLASDWNSGWGANEVVGTYRPKLFLASNGDVSGVDYAVIDSSGNLGIGTTSPGYKLVVYQDPANGVDIYGTTARFHVAIGVPGTRALYIGQDTVENMVVFGHHAASGGFSWYSHNGSAWGERMRIHTNGNVGIGTTNPGAALDVNGAIKASSGFAGPMYFPASVGGSGWLAGIGTGAAAANGNSISIDTLETMRMANGTIDGTLEVFNYYPGQTLHINGVTWCTSGTWSGSDIRWKKNIETLNNPLPKLSRLRGVTFDWRSQGETNNMKFPEGRQIGIVAQELEKEFPELVTTDKDGYKATAYDKFTAVLLEAIKAQQKEIEELKSEVLALKGAK
jgi:hypothetical protein